MFYPLLPTQPHFEPQGLPMEDGIAKPALDINIPLTAMVAEVTVTRPSRVNARSLGAQVFSCISVSP